MTISKYEVFYSVVELGSLTKAAESLNLTQSGVSHSIASLEAELGFSLLTRDRAGVTLTSNGELILKYVRETLQCNDRLRQKVAEIKGLEIGTVRVGTFTSVSSQWLPSMIKEFKSQHPGIEIKLAEGDYDDINQWILNGTVDFGFVSLPVTQSFEFIPLKKDKMLCILPNEHPLKHQDQISFAQIKEEEFIMPKWGNTGDVRRILLENNLQPKIKYEVVEDQAIIAMVQNGLGISILPEMVLLHNAHHVHIVNLEKPAYRTIGIALNSMKNTSPAARKFLSCIRSWLDRQGLLDC
ncbi:LysR family transcriptional regulator [Pelosinus sp. sgz500959]|uniref:LysR family transcriptional regulator n=1 Tax=Pelosinus sp. sgz500959 TaxID=3242472 RepID=UPI0036705DE9